MTTSEEIIKQESTFGAHNYHPLPVVFSKAEGIWVWDPEGRKYMDFLSAYSAVNQGHCHPDIVKALVDQASTLHLSARAFYNDQFGPFAQYITDYFGFDMVLPMNTGAETVETALKTARAWGYQVKGIPDNEAMILSCENNFHGRTIGVISMSTDPDCRTGFGPFVPNIGTVCPKTGRVLHYSNIQDLEDALNAHGSKVAGFLVEPIQGEAGIMLPDDGFMKKAYELCKKHNVLFIGDEIQTGIARTGKLLALDHEGVKPDILILGKALSGGLYPVSCILASKEIMLCIKPGAHGSTFGGNPLGCAVAKAALEVVKNEKLAENAEKMGKVLREGLNAIKSPFIKLIRGRGLLNAIVIDDSNSDKKAWHICLLMKKNGLLAKPTHDNIIRLIKEAIAIIEKTLREAETVAVKDIPGYDM